MSDLTEIVQQAVFASATSSKPYASGVDAAAVLAALAAPANRDALVAWLAAEGIVHEADVWDVPEVTDAQIEAANDRIDRARQAFRVAQAKAEQDNPPPDGASHAVVIARENRLMEACSNEWEEFEAAERALEELRETAKRETVYDATEDRPDDAVPLYRINREGDHG